MTVAIPQTSYSLSQTRALAGMLGDVDEGQLVIGKFTASETLLPGLVVELDPTDPTKCRLPKTASTIGKLLGVVMYSAADPVAGSVGSASSGIVAGSTVRILRRGQIWAKYNGTAGSDMLTNLNVNSSSTVATYRGILTDAATSNGAGTEIYATKMKAFEETVSGTGLVLVELNGELA